MSLIKDKQVFGWTMYDWANSAFATTVMAVFFPVFFKSYWSAGADVNTSTAMSWICQLDRFVNCSPFISDPGGDCRPELFEKNGS
jgi:hypothetical protein